MVLLTGAATGLIGDLLMWALFTVQHLSFDYHSGELLQTAAGRTRALRTAGGRFGDRRAFSGPRPPVRRAPLPQRRVSSEIDDLDLEREWWSRSPPKPGDLGGLRDRHRHGCLHRSRSGPETDGRRLRERARGLGPALACATPTAGRLRRRGRPRRGLQRPARRGDVHRRDPDGEPVAPDGAPGLGLLLDSHGNSRGSHLPEHATYARIDVPNFGFTTSLLVWALLVVGPVIGLVASGYVRLIGWVSRTTARSGRTLLVALPGCLHRASG